MWWICKHAHDDSGHFRHREDVIDFDPPHRIQRHGRHFGFVGILHNRDAARALDEHHAVRAVGHVARHDNTKGAVAEMLHRRPKERIDRRTKAVLARAVGQPHLTAINDQMKIRRCNVHRSRGDRHAVFCIHDVQLRSAPEHRRQ